MLVMLCAFSQESFEITKVGNTYSLEQIKEAFLHAKGVNIAPSCFIEDNVHYVKAIWSINDLGMIMKGFDNSAYPTEKEYYHYNHINKQ